MNEKQKKILNDQIKALKKKKTPINIMMLGGVFFIFSIIGIPLGVIIVLVTSTIIAKYDQQIKDIEFKLAE